MNKKRVSVQQHDITDCGAACLASVAAYYGLKIPIARIRQYASTDEKGTNILGITEAAEKLAFSAKGVRGTFDSLPDIPLPSIAHVVINETFYHFVVIYRIESDYIEIMDPASGKVRKMAKEEFREQWTGILILLSPNDHFEKADRKVSIWKRLRFLLKPHRSVLLQALFGAAVYTLIGLTTAIYVQLIIDHVLPDGNTNLLNLLGVVMVTLLILQIFTGAAKTVFILKTGQLIDARLILGYYKHLLKLPQRFFDTMQVGEIISRINDAVKIRSFINDAAIQLTVNVFIILFSFGLMFTYYWKLGLVMLLMLPVCALIYLIINQLNKKTQRTLMEDAASLESQLVESLNSISTIKQFGIEDYANIKTETRFVSLLRSVYRSGLNSVFSGNASTFTSRAFTILLLWTGSYFVLNGDLTTGELLSFYAVTGYFTGPVIELIGMNKVIQDALIAGDRLFEIMDLDTEDEKEKIALKPEMLGDIRLENVHFRYGTRVTVFDSLSLVIPKGKVTAFVGDSGSGKTTITNILQKLYPLQKGRILIGDLNIGHISKKSLRELIGIVPQTIHLFSGNIIDNIAVGHFDPDMERIISTCRELGILEFVENLPDGFQTRLGENGTTLSGGQKQRIAIARALYKNPEILILDEATSSLDSTAEAYVRKCVEVLRRRNKTVIIIAHRLSTVARADHICVLEKGQLCESGTHSELVQSGGRYSEMWRTDS